MISVANSSRKLIYFPVLHTAADMGELKASEEQRAIGQLGEERWRQNRLLIDQMWMDIETVLDSFSLDYTKTRLYQDGLPICANEAAIVKDLADAGSRNHRLLMRLISSGAILMGTESAELLVQEYQLIVQSMQEIDKQCSDSRKAASEELLQRRDQFIAERINKTLASGETGIDKAKEIGIDWWNNPEENHSSLPSQSLADSLSKIEQRLASLEQRTIVADAVP